MTNPTVLSSPAIAVPSLDPLNAMVGTEWANCYAQGPHIDAHCHVPCFLYHSTILHPIRLDPKLFCVLLDHIYGFMNQQI
jgi:hypothetical protein